MTNDKPTMNELLQQVAPEYMAGKPANDANPNKPIGFAAYTEGEAKAVIDSHKNALIASQVKPLMGALEGMRLAYIQKCEEAGVDDHTWNCSWNAAAIKALQDAKQCLEAVE